MIRDYFYEIELSLASSVWAETVHAHIEESDTVVPGKPITALEMLAEIDAELCNSL